jgi:hypothetical protein
MMGGSELFIEEFVQKPQRKTFPVAFLTSDF